MQAILISIQPYWCHKIIDRLKTFELRKRAPKLKPPFKCYVYMTATKRKDLLWEWDTAYTSSSGELCDGAQKVIGEFICDYIEPVTQESRQAISEKSCVPLPDMYTYAGSKGIYSLQAMHISNLKIYDKPKELSDFYTYDNSYDNSFGRVFEDGERRKPIQRPPQSWCYVQELESKKHAAFFHPSCV